MSKLWVIAYDIEDNRARKRVHNILKDHGKRVQYSVFECWLCDDVMEALRDNVIQELETGDSVRWYPLCSWCHKEITWQGTGTPADDPAYHLL